MPNLPIRSRIILWSRQHIYPWLDFAWILWYTVAVRFRILALPRSKSVRKFFNLYVGNKAFCPSFPSCLQHQSIILFLYPLPPLLSPVNTADVTQIAQQGSARTIRVGTGSYSCHSYFLSEQLFFGQHQRPREREGLGWNSNRGHLLPVSISGSPVSKLNGWNCKFQPCKHTVATIW